MSNIQKKTGKSLDELRALVRQTGLAKHGEIRDFLKREPGLGYGDANALVHAVLRSDGARAAEGRGMSELLDEIHSGPKAALRPIHDELMSRISALGGLEIVPKKGYLSLRRRKQFAMLGPATNPRLERGLNARACPPMRGRSNSARAACATTSSGWPTPPRSTRS